MMFVCVYAGTAFSFNLELKTGETARYSTPTLTHNNITGLRSPLSFFCVYTHARTHTRTLSLFHPHIHIDTRKQTHAVSFTHTHTRTVPLSLSLSLALTHTHAFKHIHTPIFPHAQSLSYKTHTQILAHAMSLFHSLSPLTRTNTTFLFFIPSLFLVFHF